METKDRIKLIMEEQHMTQQVFADFLQQSPATLSSIFNGRTRPTLNIVDSIKMTGVHRDLMLDFEAPASFAQNGQQMTHPGTHFQSGIKGPHTETGHEEYKIVEKEPRRVTEIRVYYDDQTYETFVPAKK